jgi:Type II secretion system protein C
VGKRLLIALDVLLVLAVGGLAVQLYRVWTGAPPAAGPVGPVRSSPAPSGPGTGVSAAGSPRPSTSSPPSPAAGSGAQSSAVPLGPLAAFASVAERNLFNPNRTEAPPEPPRTAATAPAPPPGPKPRLYGVVLPADGGAGRAYLEDPRTRKVFGYTVGDTVADSRVEQIRADRVVLKRGAEVFEVMLRDPSKPRPPAPPTPGTTPGGRVTPRGVPVPGQPFPTVPGQPMATMPVPGVPGMPGGVGQPGTSDDNDEGTVPTPMPPTPFIPGQPVIPPAALQPVVPGAPTPVPGPRRAPIRAPRIPPSTQRGQPAPQSAGDTGS